MTTGEAFIRTPVRHLMTSMVDRPGRRQGKTLLAAKRDVLESLKLEQSEKEKGSGLLSRGEEDVLPALSRMKVLSKRHRRVKIFGHQGKKEPRTKSRDNRSKGSGD